MQWWKRMLHSKQYIKPSVTEVGISGSDTNWSQMEMNFLRCIRTSPSTSNKNSKSANIFIYHNQVIRCKFTRILYFFGATIALWNSGASYPIKIETFYLYLWLPIVLLNRLTGWLRGWAVDICIGGTSF